MPIIARLGEKLADKAESVAYKATRKLSHGIELRYEDTKDAYRDVVDFTHHQNPPELEIRPTNSAYAMIATADNAKVRVSPLTAILFPKLFTEYQLAHELTHSKQYKTLARGAAGDSVQNGGTVQGGLEAFKAFLGNHPAFNMEHYKKVVDTEGVIKPDDPLYQYAGKIVEGMRNYTNVRSIKDNFNSGSEAAQKGAKEYFKVLKDNNAKNMEQARAYWNNPIETEARQASKDYMKAKLKAKVAQVKQKLGLQ